MTMTFGEKIREARKKLNMSQDDLAEKIGVSGRTITSWETGRALPRTRNVYEKLSEALNTSGLLSPDEAFIMESEEQFGYRGRKGAEKLVQELTGLFTGGEMAEEDMDALMLAVQQAYVDAKRKNKKYTPRKYLDRQ